MRPGGSMNVRGKTHGSRLVMALTSSAVAIASWSLAAAALGAPVRGSPAEKAKAVVAEDTGIPADQLTVAEESPFLGTGIRQFKLVDVRGKIHGVNLDASGNPIREEEMKRHAREAAKQRFVGNLDPDLAELLRGKHEGTVRLIAWMDTGTPAGPFRGEDVTPEQYEANLALVDQQIEEVTEPFVQQMQAFGARLLYRARHVPLSAWDAGVDAVRDVSRRRRDVLFFPERVHSERLN